MRARVALMSSFLLIASACGGGTAATTTAATSTTAAVTTTTEPQGFEVVSEDGDLTIEVPFEAMESDPGITIRLLAGDEYPPELAGAADNPESRIYELGPSGLEFAAPVTVTRRIDASRFGDISPTMVPVVALITYNAADGTYEPYSDLRVTRNGDDVFVSGTTTHFSPAIAVNLGGFVDVKLDDYHFGYGTELGTSLQLGYKWYGEGMVAIDPPATVEPLGFTRSQAIQFENAPAGDALVGSQITGDAPTLKVMCSKIGSAMPRLGVRATISADTAQGGPGLGTLPQLVSGLAQLEMTLKVVEEFTCLDPATSLLVALALFAFIVATDHQEDPGEDFHGGYSGLKADFSYMGGYQGWMAGAVYDADNNGLIGGNDVIYRPWSLNPTDGGFSYVAPLYGYGQYFIYVLDGTKFSAMPEGDSWTVSAGYTAFKANYTGSGRFETSIGIIGDALGPLCYEVNQNESQTTVEEGRLHQMFTGFRIQF